MGQAFEPDKPIEFRAESLTYVWALLQTSDDVFSTNENKIADGRPERLSTGGRAAAY